MKGSVTSRAVLKKRTTSSEGFRWMEGCLGRARRGAASIFLLEETPLHLFPVASSRHSASMSHILGLSLYLQHYHEVIEVILFGGPVRSTLAICMFTVLGTSAVWAPGIILRMRGLF